MSVVKEFKTFISRGNVIDLAVGVIIGGAFGKIVSSLVADIIMPPIGLILAGDSIKRYKIPLKEAVIGQDGEVIKEAVSLNLGKFFQASLDFLIIAIAIFLIVKVVNSFHKKEQEKNTPPPPAQPTKEEVLLTEIRDLLQQQNRFGGS